MDMTYFDSFFYGNGNSKNKDFKLEKRKDHVILFYKLLDLAMGRYKYQNLPDTMDERFLELSLVYSGCAGVAKVSIAGEKEKNTIMNLSISGGDYTSPYGYPNSYNLLDYCGRSYGTFVPYVPGQESYADSVMILENKRNIPPMSKITWYADRLADIQASIRSAIYNLRSSLIIECSEEQETPVRAALKNADDGEPILFSFNGAASVQGAPTVITNPQTPEILKSLTEIYDKTFADFLTEFGINANAVVNKMSGTSPDELNQNVEVTRLANNIGLECRKEGIDKVNKMFGTNIVVISTIDNIRDKEYNNYEGDTSNDTVDKEDNTNEDI